MKHSRLVLFVLLLAIIATYGCSAKPTEQIARTEKAMQEAKANYAEQFAAENWAAAQKAYNDAMARVEQGKYGDANMLLLKAKTGFDKANELAKGLRATTEREIKNSQSVAQQRLDVLKKSITDKKLTGTRKQSLDESIKGFEEKLAKITTQLENGQFQDAKYLSGSTLREIWEVQQELEPAAKGKKSS